MNKVNTLKAGVLSNCSICLKEHCIFTVIYFFIMGNESLLLKQMKSVWKML